jgi:hypothetical protein
MSDWSKGEVEKLRQTLAAKSAFDAAFRKELLANPNKVIEETAGKKIPDGYSIDVIESKPGVVATFVLPNFYGDKLGKEELAAIAGGRSGTVTSQTTYTNTTTTLVEEVEVVTTEVVNLETTATVGAEAAVVVVGAVVLI